MVSYVQSASHISSSLETDWDFICFPSRPFVSSSRKKPQKKREKYGGKREEFSCFKFEGNHEKWVASNREWAAKIKYRHYAKGDLFEVNQQTPVSDWSANFFTTQKLKFQFHQNIVSWNQRYNASRIFVRYFHLGSMRQSDDYWTSLCCWLCYGALSVTPNCNTKYEIIHPFSLF